MGYFRFEDDMNNGQVGGEMEGRGRGRGKGNGGDVAGAQTRPVKFRGVIDSRDLCNFIRECVAETLLAGVEDDNDHKPHCGCRKHRR